jgi:CubicO group peptidase (beta-lactamase class C family)
MSTAGAQGFSVERLRSLDRFLQARYIASGRLPGLQLVVARRGQVVHETVLGLRDVERGLPCEPDTVFRIYSMTKPLTSVVLMSLVEEGAIALEDPVGDYIPSWENLAVYESGVDGAFVTSPVRRPMQVVDLLRHTSGLTYGFQERTPVDAAYRARDLDQRNSAFDLEEFVEALADIPLEFSPGEAWNYSVSTDVVGYLIQKVAGRPLEQVIQARLLDPLKMHDTGFVVRPEQTSRFAACYAATRKRGLKLQDDPQTSPYLAARRFVSGGGGMVSTAADYQRFVNMMLNGGELEGARILAPSTVRLMTTNHLPGGADLASMSVSLYSESTNEGVGFGLGFAVAFNPTPTLLPSSPGEYYWGGAASTAFWIDPVEQVTAILMTQVLPSSEYPIRRELRTLVYSALMEPNG